MSQCRAKLNDDLESMRRNAFWVKMKMSVKSMGKLFQLLQKGIVSTWSILLNIFLQLLIFTSAKHDDDDLGMSPLQCRPFMSKVFAALYMLISG